MVQAIIDTDIAAAKGTAESHAQLADALDARARKASQQYPWIAVDLLHRSEFPGRANS